MRSPHPRQALHTFNNEMKSILSMATSLKDLWKAGKDGCLSPLEQCRAWALREVYREMDVPEKKLYTKMAAKLTKIGGGHPTSRAVLLFFEKADNDEEWYPGKVEEGRGRPPALNGVARGAIQRSAEAMKRNGGEPTYTLILGSCPEAVKNPDTSEPVDKKRVYDVFREQCYDDGAEQPWKHRARLTKTGLPDYYIEKRWEWMEFMEGQGRSAEWYYKNLIWIDFCNAILPRSEKKAADQALARKGGSGWMSQGCQMFSCNLRGDRTTLKQNSEDTVRVWFMPVLTRGKLHVECFLEDFPGENSRGAQQAAQRLGPILNRRFPNETKPKFVMTDKGKGFYCNINQMILPRYKAGLQSSGLKAFMGDDASMQPGKMSDLMLHETAVAWLRLKMKWSTPKEPWLETTVQWKARMQEACRQVNAEYDVEGLCRELPGRLEKLREKEGDRLKK